VDVAVTNKTVAAAVALSAIGDLAGLAHQALSADRPPIPAMILSGVLAFAALAVLRPLAAGLARARRVALGTRVGDLLLLTAAAVSGHLFGEPTDHVIPAVLQFLLSLTAAVLLTRTISDTPAPPVATGLPATTRS
jgi:hypothetical protein